MKQSWQCPKCKSLKVGYLETVLDESDRGSVRRVGQAQTGSLLGLAVMSNKGEFEAFVCTECGYFEEYVKNPAAIAWDQLRGFRWCRPEPNARGPFR